jgi:hypothetical protein
MNARDIPYGLELETIAPDSAVQNDGLRIGPYKRGIQVPFLPTGWTAESDGSIDNSNGGHRCEIVSPILRGEDGIRQVIEVCRTLEAKGFRVNASCGVHVHVSFSRELPSATLARLVTIVAYVEKGLYAITGTKNRERGINGRCYCNGIRKYGSEKDAKPNLDRNRYHALNLTNLAHGTKDTVEFRVFSGTTSGLKAATWIMVCLGLVERAIHAKRMPRWTPGALKGGWKKAGPGQSEAERLMGYLAWGAGYERIAGRRFGWISDAFAMDEAKAELRRLARKYDAMP